MNRCISSMAFSTWPSRVLCCAQVTSADGQQSVALHLLAPDRRQSTYVLFAAAAPEYSLTPQPPPFGTTDDPLVGTMRQLTFEGGAHAPVWSPDGKRIAYTAATADSDEDLYIQPADGSGSATRVLQLPDDQHAGAWPSDDALLFNDAGAVVVNQAGGDISVVDPTVTPAVPRAYLAAPWSESDIAVSPDRRFAAYSSDETGLREVYVRNYPVPGAQWKISEGGGRAPRWSPDGRTIYYRTNPGTIESAQVSTASGVTVVSRARVSALPGLGAAWDVNPRTGRIAVAQTAGTTLERRMVVVVNWLEVLRRSARAAGQ